MNKLLSNDLQNGQRTIWYENGNKRLVATVQNDKMEGKANGWFSNGQQQFNYHFVNNLEHGDCSEWNNEGKKISKIKFSNGIPVTDLMTGQPYNSEQKDPAAPDGQTDENKFSGNKDVEIDSSLEKENVDNGKRESSSQDTAKIKIQMLLPLQARKNLPNQSSKLRSYF